MSRECVREGCTRIARMDDYCSRDCFENEHVVREQAKERRERRNKARRLARLRKKMGDSIEVANPDAMAYKVDGHHGQERKRTQGESRREI